MKDIQQAKVILRELDKYIQVNWNAEEYYLTGIVKGIEAARKLKKKI